MRDLKPYTKSYGNSVLYKKFFERRIEGDGSEGSKAYLTCVKGWKLLEGTPAVQTCILVNGKLVWTPAGTCVYRKSCSIIIEVMQIYSVEIKHPEGGRESA